jgi:hypothetical protein
MATKLFSYYLRLGLVGGVALAAITPARAQNPAAETLQLKMGAPTAIPLPPAPSTINNPDTGQISIVQQYPKPETLTVATSQEFFYTDNVFFTENNPVSSTAYLGGYTVSYVPYSLRDWTPRITLQYNMVRYDGEASGDFDNENVAFSSQYIFSQDRTWFWLATINLSRFTDPHENDHAFYNEVLYDNQLTRVKQFSHNLPLFFIFSYDLAYHQADPDVYDRLDNMLSFGLAYYPIPSVSIRPFVRPAARIYLTDNAMTDSVVQSERHDFNMTEGLEIGWTPVKYTSLTADFTQSNDYSSASGQSYNQSSPGVSLSGEVRFW